MNPGQDINHYVATTAKGIGNILHDNVHNQASSGFRTYFKGTQMLLMQAQESGAVLDEEQLLFLAGERATNFDDDVDDLALNVDHVFETDQCDAFDLMLLRRPPHSPCSWKKAETSVPKPLSALTVYPPNTPVKLSNRVSFPPFKSRISEDYSLCTHTTFLEFDKICKKRITQQSLQEGEKREFKRPSLKKLKLMEEIFDQMSDEVVRMSVDKQCAEIVKNNFSLKMRNLIANCLSTSMLFDVEKSRLSTSSKELFRNINIQGITGSPHDFNSSLRSKNLGNSRFKKRQHMSVFKRSKIERFKAALQEMFEVMYDYAHSTIYEQTSSLLTKIEDLTRLQLEGKFESSRPRSSLSKRRLKQIKFNHRFSNVTMKVSLASLQAPFLKRGERVVSSVSLSFTIRKGNLLLDLQKLQKNPIFRISVDIRQNTNFVRAFTTSANVPSIYIQLFWNTLTHDVKTGVYSFQVNEHWLTLSADLLRKALNTTPAALAHPFESPPASTQMSLEVSQAYGQAHVNRVAICEPAPLSTRKLPVVEVKGKGSATDAQAVKSLLELHKPKKQRTMD
ncbi:hypothetical protein Tco_1328712 [Tanacetum coccineum]